MVGSLIEREPAMTRITLLVILMTLPGLVTAQSTCSEAHQAQSCAQGTTWNDQSKSCEPVSS
ncbi:hypothetical protein NBRC116586_27080 [Pseudooceanicola nitratireducens]